MHKTTWTMLLLLAATAFAQAQATYYVDENPARGSDAHDGRSPQQPWCTLAKVNATPLQPGDTVRFRRGETWRGQLVPQNGAPGRPITYGAYGEGAKPRLLGSVAMNDPQSWTSEGNDLWSTPILRFELEGVIPQPPGRGPWLHQESGAEATATKLPPQADRPAQWIVQCRQPGTKGNHLQFILPNINIPVEAGQFLALPLKLRSSAPFALANISLSKDGAPYTAYGRARALPLVVGTNWSQETVIFEVIQSATNARIAFYLGGAVPAGAEFQMQLLPLQKARCNQAVLLTADVGNIIFDGGQSTGWKRWAAAELKAEGDYWYDAARSRVLLKSAGNPAQRHRSIELALSRHIINQGGRAHVTYEQLDLRYGAAHGIGGGETRNIMVRDCEISFIGGGHQHTRPDGKPVRYGNGVEFWSGARDCLVERCRIWEIYDAALTNQGSGTNVQENITYRDNVIWNSEYSFEYWNRGEASRTRNIRFENNTCVDAGFGWGNRQRPDRNGRHLMFYDNSATTAQVLVRSNLFVRATDSCLRLHGRDWTAALTMDYNLWHQPQGPLVLWDKENIAPAQFAAFMQKRGLDQHSLVAEPRFVNPAKRDYRLPPDSPAQGWGARGMTAPE